jgi:Protein of unknown function (DUF2948)
MSSLKLLAQDEEDLSILSAHLQDAIIRLGDIAYIAKQRRFAAVVSRFCWEGCPDGEKGTRVRAGLHFDSVLSVKKTKLLRNDPDSVAELLAIQFVPRGETGGFIDLVLAGGGRIRLEVECIEAQLRDLTEPRPAVARPVHNLEHN